MIWLSKGMAYVDTNDIIELKHCQGAISISILVNIIVQKDMKVM